MEDAGTFFPSTNKFTRYETIVPNVSDLAFDQPPASQADHRPVPNIGRKAALSSSIRDQTGEQVLQGILPLLEQLYELLLQTLAAEFVGGARSFQEIEKLFRELSEEDECGRATHARLGVSFYQ